MPSTLAGSSVSPGTSVKRAHTGLFNLARRSAKRRVGARSRPVTVLYVSGFVDAIAEKTRGFDRRVQTHFLGAGEDALSEGKLHQDFAARDCQPAIQCAQGRSKLSEAINDLLSGDVGSVLQMPSIRVVTVGAAKQAARYEQYRAQAWPVV